MHQQDDKRAKLVNLQEEFSGEDYFERVSYKDQRLSIEFSFDKISGVGEADQIEARVNELTGFFSAEVIWHGKEE